jgi:DNA polymerase III subunit beta
VGESGATMNIKVDRDLFLGELYYLQGVAGAKHAIPILSHLMIEASPDKITMRATDLDLMIPTECEAVVREHGSICLPARKLMEIVKSLPQAEIEIRANDLYQATINCAPSRFKMNGLSADDFPESQEYSGPFSEIPAEIFSRFIPRVIHAAGHEGSRYALNGAKLEISNERIKMVTTDGHRLALVEHEGRFSGGLDVLLPKRAVIELGKLCAGSDEMLRIGKADNHIHFHLGKRRIVSRLLTGIYPDYSAVLPKENFNRFTVGRGMITPAIKLVSLMAEDRSRAIKMEIGEGEMRISSECCGIGEAGETIPIAYDGDRITAGFNAAYLNDFFHAIEEEEVLFEFKDAKTQAQIKVHTADEDRFVEIVMPLLLS